MAKLFSLDSVKKNSSTAGANIIKRDHSEKEVAVIGISGKLAGSETLDEFWEKLAEGTDFIKDIPKERKRDCEGIAKALRKADSINDYVQSGYLNNIDHFDYKMFALSPKESALMDPQQRMFLQSAFSAIEDAGYGGDQLSGTDTGIFMGYSEDFGEEYKKYIQKVDPDSIGLSIPGNIKSIIASRIAYVLDLKGPSILVDTACSSSLVAVHLACQSLRNRECAMALSGSVKINLLPVRTKKHEGIGIESSDDRAKTFDESSDGTGTGEGVVVLVLKLLSKALEDRDNIYAVIKGSAINQDGRSNGITAPNSEAQENAILRAWKDAGVKADQISYIEAHGTGTELGDPIEISGIQRAFRNYTEKRQFCAIGSIKSAIGHLDHAAGIAGLAKVILSLKNKKIPPTLHFQRPNRRINFSQSPVYVNDRLSSWDPPENEPRICGISSFGLSGTNCHMILQEAPVIEKKGEIEKEDIFTLSARSIEELLKLVDQFIIYLKKNPLSALEDICFTQNSGRGNYDYRLGMVVKNRAELLHQLETVKTGQLKGDLPEGVLFNQITIVPDNVNSEKEGLISETEKRSLSKKAAELLKSRDKESREICGKVLDLYLSGADIPWNNFYSNKLCRRLSLPVFPLEKSRCWVDYVKVYEKTEKHPLLDNCIVDILDLKIFSKNYNPYNDWVIGEHLVSGNYVLPGTVFIEKMGTIAKIYYGFEKQALRDIIFTSPFVLREDETRELQTVVKEKTGYLDISFISKGPGESQWIKHSEGKVYHLNIYENRKIEYQKVIERCGQKDLEEFSRNQAGAVEVGKRWQNLKNIYFGHNECLAEFSIADEYYDDVENYNFYPPLLDDCVNISNKSQNGNDYLPFSYKSMQVNGPLPQKVFSHIKKISSEGASDETIMFDISIMDPEGNVIIDITEYTVKKLHKPGAVDTQKLFQQVQWIPSELDHVFKANHRDICTLFFHNHSPGVQKIMKELKLSGANIIEVEFGDSFSQVSDSFFVISGEAVDYLKLGECLAHRGIERIIHAFNMTEESWISDIEEFDLSQKIGVYSLYHLTQGFMNNIFRNNIEIILIADNASMVIESQDRVNPHHASFFGLAKVLPLEYENLKIRCIDVDNDTAFYYIVEEILKHGLIEGNQFEHVAYRHGTRYIEQLDYMDIGCMEDRVFEIKSHGTYLITGGLGAIGLTIADYLSKVNTVNIVLIGRTPFPQKDQWPDILAEKTDKGLCSKINAILKIEDRGSQVAVYHSDVADYEKMESVVSSVREKFGKIDGIVHAAGVAGDGFIILKDIEKFKEVVDVKTKGTWVLDSLTKEDNPDFFAAFSSIASFISKAGQGDYTAANLYLDSFASTDPENSTKKVSINWAAWKDAGMAVKYGLKNVEGIYRSIPTQTALDAFVMVLSKQATRAVVGELDYDALELEKEGLQLRLSDQIKEDIRLFAKKRSERNLVVSSGKPREGELSIMGKSKKKLTETEVTLSNIWADVLGLNEINIHHNFNDMGGDSILATSLLRSMEKTFPGVLNISDIFTYSTVSTMAEYVEKKQNSKDAAPRVLSRDGSGESDSDESNLGDILAKLARGEIDASEVDNFIDLEGE